MNEIFKLDMGQAMKLLGMRYQQHCDVNENENDNDIVCYLLLTETPFIIKLGPRARKRWCLCCVGVCGQYCLTRHIETLAQENT
jgi:hypothetical protein